MKRSVVLVLCLAAIACVAYLLRPRHHNGRGRPDDILAEPLGSHTPGVPPSPELRERRAAETAARREAESQVNAGALALPEPARTPEEKEQRIAAVNDASTLYSPEGIPKIKPYLLDPDAEIRAAAKDAMVNLGEAGGGAALRAAAKQLKDPREAAGYLETADFLELPTWSELHPGESLPGTGPPANSPLPTTADDGTGK